MVLGNSGFSCMLLVFEVCQVSFHIFLYHLRGIPLPIEQYLGYQVPSPVSSIASLYDYCGIVPCLSLASPCVPVDDHPRKRLDPYRSLMFDLHQMLLPERDEQLFLAVRLGFDQFFGGESHTIFLFECHAYLSLSLSEFHSLYVTQDAFLLESGSIKLLFHRWPFQPQWVILIHYIHKRCRKPWWCVILIRWLQRRLVSSVDWLSCVGLDGAFPLVENTLYLRIKLQLILKIRPFPLI